MTGSVTLINKHKPEVVLMGATGLGRDLAGAVATALKTGLTADCTGLTIDKKMRLLEQTRPAFGGNIMATILTEICRPQMASVRPHVMPKHQFQPGKKGERCEENEHFWIIIKDVLHAIGVVHKIEELMRDLSEDYTIIIVTHNMQQAARVSDYTAFFTLNENRAGFLMEFGPTNQLFTNPKEKVTEDYITGHFG